MNTLLNHTHDPAARSWLASANHIGGDFPIQNLPLGIFSEAKGQRRPGVAIGDYILDLTAIAELLGAQGAAVVVNDLGGSVSGEGASHDADLTTKLIEQRGGEAVANYGDVADDEMHLNGPMNSTLASSGRLAM